jgi:hypothetical protein
MFFKYIEKLCSVHFKHLTDVKCAVFEQILKSLNEVQAKSRKHPRSGTPAKPCNADKLLLLIMYYREYRTQFHIGITYGISESRFCEIIRKTESVLIQDPRFHLPWKKVLLKEVNRFEVVLIDVTESVFFLTRKVLFLTSEFFAVNFKVCSDFFSGQRKNHVGNFFKQKV